MELEIKNEVMPQVRFFNCGPREMFEFNGRVYMRIRTITDSHEVEKINAVCLTDGSGAWFTSNVPVRLIHATLTYDYE